MSCLWLCLSLLCAATFLQSWASSEPGVSLKCNQTVEVLAGKTVTLNCTVTYSLKSKKECKCLHYGWKKSNVDIPCHSGLMKYNCEWDKVTYVSLTILDVTEEENYSVFIRTDCGWSKSVITVQVIPPPRDDETRSEVSSEQATNPPVTAASLSVFIILIVSGILCFLFGTESGKKILKHIKKDKTQGQSLMQL